jgi:hypothetical protein
MSGISFLVRSSPWIEEQNDGSRRRVDVFASGVING